MGLRNEEDVRTMTVGGEEIRYPGIARMLLFRSVIGALTVARYHLDYAHKQRPERGYRSADAVCG